jgi:fatty-acyl-CoA synthase
LPVRHYDWIAHFGRRTPDKTAVVDLGSERHFTYAQFDARMYISGGENVYPAEVENVLHQISAIAEAAILGIPDPQWGEVGMAIVAVKPGHSLNEAEIHAHCAANLARFKCPRPIGFVDVLPRNATGKIHKPTVRERFSIASVTDLASPS